MSFGSWNINFFVTPVFRESEAVSVSQISETFELKNLYFAPLTRYRCDLRKSILYCKTECAISIQGLIKNEVEFRRVTKKKVMWNFQGSWFLTLKFPRYLANKNLEFPGVELFCLEFAGVRWKKWKFPGRGVFRKVCPQPLFFSGIAQYQKHCTLHS